ncbi:hypothetical protein AVEN_262682-1 [Araneus ventricosus]|uniref:Uncharacterized protein n=1 Tax=Araneus ventricosus TaxID=182803 RepID=A0A4Y2IZU4_ARAVE|nr:hypothetical protein AVEN_262682-1 [Araneus ventricosus]
MNDPPADRNRSQGQVDRLDAILSFVRQSRNGRTLDEILQHLRDIGIFPHHYVRLLKEACMDGQLPKLDKFFIPAATYRQPRLTIRQNRMLMIYIEAHPEGLTFEQIQNFLLGYTLGEQRNACRNLVKGNRIHHIHDFLFAPHLGGQGE